VQRPVPQVHAQPVPMAHPVHVPKDRTAIDLRHAQGAAWQDQLAAQRDFTLHHNSGPGGNDYAGNKAFSDMHQAMIHKPGAFQYGQHGPLDYSHDNEGIGAFLGNSPRPGTPQYDESRRMMTPDQRGQQTLAGKAWIDNYNATHNAGPGVGGVIAGLAGLGVGAGFGAAFPGFAMSSLIPKAIQTGLSTGGTYSQSGKLF
jgi:hypothetical protein